MKNLNIKVNNKELKLNKKSVIKLAFALAFIASITLNTALAYKLNQSNLMLNQYSNIAKQLVTQINTITQQVKDQEQKIKHFSENIKFGRCEKK